ncbi:HAD family hydrolase [Nonomuraea sp. NPDC049309]|uniref:HAD family hydrolase n=1 Tax=Nonomuraea sp. NPDC049309 TaxID=3364350 RepID=UPI00370FC2F7
MDGWVISGVEGVAKPDGRLFAAGAAACGASPDGGGWMVGDDPEKDIAGGRGAGLTTIWIDHGHAPRPAEADHAVTDVLAAIELIERSEQPG